MWLDSEQSYTSDIIAHQCEILRPLLFPKREGLGRPPELNPRSVVNAVFYGRLVAWAWITGGWPLKVVSWNRGNHHFQALPHRWVV